MRWLKLLKVEMGLKTVCWIGLRFLAGFAISSASLVFLGCTATQVSNVLSPSTPKVMALDLSGTIDGQPWNGIAVGSAAPSHTIVMTSKVNVNEFRVISCHRFEKHEDVVEPEKWFHGDTFQYIYNEAPGVEDTGFCILRLQAFTKSVDASGNPAGSAFGLMLFHSPSFTLPAINICNGQTQSTAGSAICQSMNGLIERLKFSEQVITANDAATGVNGIPMACKGKFIDATTWEFALPVGECMAVFASVAPPHKFFVLMGYGFTNSTYRGR